MDRAFEGIINVGFYAVAFCIVLGVFGIDPFVLLASISGFVLGFAFMVSMISTGQCEKWALDLLTHGVHASIALRLDLLAPSTLREYSSFWCAIPTMLETV